MKTFLDGANTRGWTESIWTWGLIFDIHLNFLSTLKKFCFLKVLYR